MAHLKVNGVKCYKVLGNHGDFKEKGKFQKTVWHQSLLAISRSVFLIYIMFMCVWYHRTNWLISKGDNLWCTINTQAKTSQRPSSLNLTATTQALQVSAPISTKIFFLYPSCIIWHTCRKNPWLWNPSGNFGNLMPLISFHWNLGM